jgi:phage terminase large subunit
MLLLGTEADSKTNGFGANKTQTTINMSEVVGGGYDEFWKFRGRYRLVKGGRGSKKSSTAALWYIYHMMLFWYKFHIQVEMLCLRAYFVNHADSTYAQLKWAINRLGVEHLWRCYRNPLHIKFLPSGGRILFRGLDDPEKITSIKSPNGHIAWVWLEEAYEVKSAQQFEKVNLSIRGVLPKPLFYQMTFTFNPYSDKTWLKSRYFDHVDPETGISEDGRIMAITRNFDCNEFLDDDFLAEMERIKQLHPNEYNVVGLGNWGIQKGLIFTNWVVKEVRLTEDSSVHTTLENKIRLLAESGFYLRCGLDFGFTNDITAFVICMVNTNKKEVYILDEITGTGMTPKAIARAIAGKGVIFSSAEIVADSSNPMAIDLIRREGIRGIIKSVKGAGSVLAGIENLRQYKIFVDPVCMEMRIELENYKWQVSKDDDEVFINEPMDEFNHCIDALRYAMEKAHANFFDVGGNRQRRLLH